jgi:hypothetical protein
MSIHLFAIIPLVVSLVLFTLGIRSNVWEFHMGGLFFMVWGVAIHAKNLAVFREKMRYGRISFK